VLATSRVVKYPTSSSDARVSSVFVNIYRS
jgi:hypothetical protein